MGGFQNQGVCRQAFASPLLPYPLQFFFFFCARPNVTRPEKEFASRPLETLATQAILSQNLSQPQALCASVPFLGFPKFPIFVVIVRMNVNLLFPGIKTVVNRLNIQNASKEI